MADDDAQILMDAKKLPLAERVAHKSWKARCDAYNDMLLTCERAFSGDDPCFVELGMETIYFCLSLLLSGALRCFPHPHHLGIARITLSLHG